MTGGNLIAELRLIYSVITHLLYIRICGESGKALINTFQDLFSLHRFPELFSLDFSNLSQESWVFEFFILCSRILGCRHYIPAKR